MRSYLLILLLSSIYITSAQVPQPPAPAAPQQAPRPWTDHVRRATVSLGVIKSLDGKPTYQTVGTGVIVCHDERTAFIVTAKHIFDDPAKSWRPGSLALRFSFEQKESLTDDLGAAVQLLNPWGKILWASPSDGADIAVLPAPATLNGRLTDCIGYQDFATTDDVYDGASVFTFGYPDGEGVLAGPQAMVRALTRSGVIAWTDPNNPSDKPFLIDSSVLPGNSGGPAYSVPSGLTKYGVFSVSNRIAFLGIVTSGLLGTVQVGEQPLQVQLPGVAAPAHAGVEGIGALGRVEPAAAIKALIEKTYFSK